MKRVWVDLNVLFFGQEPQIVTALAGKRGCVLDEKLAQGSVARSLNSALKGQIDLKQLWHDAAVLFQQGLEEWPHEEFLDDLVGCFSLTQSWQDVLNGLKRGQFTGAIVNHVHLHLATPRALSEQFSFTGRISPQDTKDYNLYGEESLIDCIYAYSIAQGTPVEHSMIIGSRDNKTAKAAQYGFKTLCVAAAGPEFDKIALISQMRKAGVRVQFEGL